MIISKLAVRNLLGRGLRTWLNVIVLSFSFVAIIGMQGLYQGMDRQITRATVDVEYGGGQYWHDSYDPFDPLSLEDAHGTLPQELQAQVNDGKAMGILVIQGTIYPNGRIRPVMLKGIDPAQQIIDLPTHTLKTDDESVIPGFIGTRMAKNSGLKKGDYVTVRWRDAEGTFDATELHIVEIMNTPVQSVDNAQVWIPVSTLQRIAGMDNEFTLVTIDKNEQAEQVFSGWVFRDHDYLLKDVKAMVQSKTIGGSIMYIILLSLAMIAIFDTQILSIFRRRREMGMLMAMGLTRFKVIQLFTLEGTLNGFLAALVGAVYGIPLLYYAATTGWAMPEMTDSYGFAIGTRLYPTYSLGLIAGTTVLVLMVTLIVSYLPTRNIAKLKPTDALRGKMA